MSRATKRLWRTGALALAAAVILGACGSSGKSNNSAASPGSSGGVHCSGISLGFFGALTGDSANLGINEKNGVKLAIDQFNQKNPGCQVGFKTFDSQGSPDQAPALATQAVQESSLVGLIGPAFSGESKVADPIFQQAGLPTITASATKPTLSTNGWTIFHRAVGNDNAQGPAAARYITSDLKFTKVAVIDDASEYGKGIADIVRTKVKDGGGTVVASESIDPKGTDFSSTVTKIKAGNAQAVFFGGYYQAAGVLVKQMRDAGVNATFVGPDGTEDPGFVTAAGATAAEGAVLTAPAAPISQVSGGPAFQTAYKASSGQDVGLYSVEAYDAANAFLTAIASGKTTRSAINNYLNNNLNFQGLSKTLKFDKNGELAGTVTIYAYTVRNGAIVPLKALS
jgi:branched-chain amino acid transport system substrate-binding protein